MEILNLENNGSSIPSSAYFTSILPSATVQGEEIHMQDMGNTCGNNEIDVIHPGRDDVVRGEQGIDGAGISSRSEGIVM